MTKKEIHKIIFRNLLIGGLVISTLVGSSVFFIEQHQIDDYVAKLALQESTKYTLYYSNYHQSPTQINLARLEKALNKSLDDDRFIFIEVFDQQLKPIAAESLEEFRQMRAKLKQAFPSFQMAGRTEYIKTSLDGEQYVKVMVPIFANNILVSTKHFGGMFHPMDAQDTPSSENSAVIGHFIGIYHVGETILSRIYQQILLSVLYSILIVFLTTLLVYPVIIQLSNKLSLLSLSLLESNINTIKSLGSAIAKRDSDTHAHNYRVTLYAVKLAETLKLNMREIQALIKGAFLHDIGKIGIPDAILCKPDKLTETEFTVMKQHVVLGEDIVRDNRWLADAIDVVRYHHEKYDGSGYTEGLKGKDIPINAKIFALADVFDALTSKRPYKEAYPVEKALNIIRQGSGNHFDPLIVKAFETIARQMYEEMSQFNNESALSQQLDGVIKCYFADMPLTI